MNEGGKIVDLKFSPCTELEQGIGIACKTHLPKLTSSESEYVFLTHQSKLFFSSFITELLNNIPESGKIKFFNFIIKFLSGY